jgi:phosphoribosyl-ATP pyrophosphohydrolase
MKTEILAELAAIIKQRKSADPESSWTAKLLSQGVERCAKKFGEEAVEAALASVSGDKAHLKAEAADVIYHLLVLLEAAGVDLADVLDELAARQQRSGIAEKASRGKP